MDQVSILIPLGIFLSIIAIVLFIIIFHRWKSNQNIVSKDDSDNWTIFDGIIVSSERRHGWKMLLGLSVKSKIFISDKYLVITADKMSFSLLQSELPVMIEKKNYDLIEKVKLNSWNSVTIVLTQRSQVMGNYEIEFLMETMDAKQKEELYQVIMNWRHY